MASAGKVGALLVEMRADLGKLRLDVKEMEKVFSTSFTNLQSQATSFGRNLLAAFGVGLSVNAIVNFGKGVVDLAGKLTDLSEQTGISAQTLSGIKSTLEENGTSVDALATGLVRLQKELLTIKNEADPAAQAFKALGLNYKELAKLGTEDLLKTLTDALAKQDDVARRNAIGLLTMSRSARELIPGLTAIAGRLDELKAKGMNPKDIKLLDDFGDALTRLGNVAKILASGPLAELVAQFNAIVGITEQGRITKGLIEVEDQIEKLQRTLERRTTSRAKGSAVGALIESIFPTPKDDAALREQLKKLETQRTELDRAQQRLNEPPKPAAKPTGESITADTSAINKLKSAVDSFISSLQKQSDSLRVNITELGGGGQAAKALALDLEFGAFQAKLLADNLKMPAGVEQKFKELKATILGLNVELTKTKEILERIAIDEADAAEGRAAQQKAGLAPFAAQDANTIRRTAELGEMLTRDFDDTAQATREWGEEGIKAMKVMGELTISMQAISKESALMGSGFDATSAKIDAVRNALRNLTSGPEFEEAKTQLQELLNIQEAEKLGAEIGGSISQGLKNTLLGIETGQQTVGEGMKNLVRNMMLELQGAIFDKTILKPLEAIASGFITGFVGALDTAANDKLKKWAEGLGKSLSSWLGTGLQAILGAFGGGGGAFAGASSMTYTAGGSFPIGGRTFGSGGMIPSFAGGGLFIGHGGEFVMQKKAVDNIGADTLGAMNRTGKVPSGGSVVNVEINGDITPRQPNMTPDQVVRVTAGNITNDGMVMSAIEQRLRMRGK